MSRSAAAAVLASLAALGLPGCGEESSGGAAGPQGDGGATQTAPSATGRAAECGRVEVPGHEAVELRATGVGCEVAEPVAAAAQGRGRRPYQAEGFACEPAEAGGGDTNYTCTRGGARIRFRYGTA